MYLYSNISMDLEISRSETDKYFRQQESLSSQLQVVYEHRARLERSLQKEKTDHKSTKLDSSRKQNDFMLNITRSKHEAMNRFNSLETQYNMLKAQNKELDTDYNRLRQQYTRLSSEHSQLNSELKRNFQLYKEQKTNEIASLDEEIKTLKQQVVQLRTHLKSKADEVEQYKSSSSRALRVSQQHQETLRTLEEKLTFYKEKLKKSQLERDEAVKGGKQDKGKTAGGRRQGVKSLDSNKEGVDDQEEKEKSQQEKELQPGVDRDTSQERYHGQRYVPTTASIVTDSDQGDEGREADENKNKHKQDIYDHGYSDQRRDSESNREESKRSENSQRENDQRQVALRDSSENRGLEGRDTGVQVVSPKENSTNKWANIKAAQQGNAPEQGKKENNDKGKEEQGEGEGNEGKRSKRSVYDYMQEVTEPSRLQERDMQSYNQKQPGEEEKETDKWNGRPVAQRPANSDVRLQDPGNQGENAQPTQEQYEHRDTDNQQREEEEDLDEQESDLSRNNINKQMAEMQESYNEKQTNQQRQEQEMQILPQERNSDARGRSVYQHVAPIPAVHRQDTAEEQSDADNDDEDANTEQDTEEDPDDADEDDVLEARDSPEEEEQQQQQQHHQLLPPPQHLRPIQDQIQPREGRTFDRALKSANSNINYRPNE